MYVCIDLGRGGGAELAQRAALEPEALHHVDVMLV